METKFIYNLNNKKIITVGCILSVIFLDISKDTDSTVCIIKTKQNCRFTQECTCMGAGIRAQLQQV